MSEEDKQRVEPSLSGAGRAINQTPEHIEALRARQRQHEKLTQPLPQQKFTDVLQKSQAQAQEALQTKNPELAEASSPKPKALEKKPLPTKWSRPHGKKIIRG